MARPTSYDKALVEKAEAYLKEFELKQSEREGTTSEEVIPTIVGLCRYIERGKTTVYNWIAETKDKEKDTFRDICSGIAELQEIKLVTGGLVGGWNPQVTKMILTKHGYSDKQEIDHGSSDGSMTPKTYSPTDYATAQLAVKDKLGGLD
tara:strand:- start:1705 stop:2151 length:447 start_codon:yes stop_codon:yes gene_type:complete